MLGVEARVRFYDSDLVEPQRIVDLQREKDLALRVSEDLELRLLLAQVLLLVLVVVLLFLS